MNPSLFSLKKSVFEACLEEGEVFVYVWPHQNLILPRLEFPVKLHYGLNQPNPIPDMKIMEEGIKATLSFNQTRVATFIPWASIGVIGLMDKSFACQWEVSREPEEEVKPKPMPKNKLRSIELGEPGREPTLEEWRKEIRQKMRDAPALKLVE